MNVKLRDFVYLTEFISHDSVVVVIEQLLLSTVTKCECWQTNRNNYTTITKHQLLFWKSWNLQVFKSFIKFTTNVWNS